MRASVLASVFASVIVSVRASVIVSARVHYVPRLAGKGSGPKSAKRLLKPLSMDIFETFVLH